MQHRNGFPIESATVLPHCKAPTMKNTFYSKVILFGEYSMIFDSTALMIPFRNFRACWQYGETDNKSHRASTNSLLRFCRYLADNELLSQTIDCKSLETDLNLNLFLNSDIPSSYGLGSSGALVAAVYARYAVHPTSDLLELKRLFGIMESCFHGSSSGIDPLQCYVGQPFKISPGKGVELLDEQFLQRHIQIGLIDTHIKSKTAPLVAYFKQQRQDPMFLQQFQNDYLPHVNACIANIVAGNDKAFFTSLNELSKGQMRFLRPMITDNTLPLFHLRPDFRLGVKISGSGGGGFLLCFTDNKDKAVEVLKDFNVIWI